MVVNIYNAQSDEVYRNIIGVNVSSLSADYISYHNNCHNIFKKNISYNFISKLNDPEKYSDIGTVLQQDSNIYYENISFLYAHTREYKYIYTLYIRSLPQECNILCQPGEVRKIEDKLCYKKNFIEFHTPCEVLEDVRTGKCLLLLNDSYECTVLTATVMETLLMFCKELCIPTHNVLIVTGNMCNMQNVELIKYPFKITYLQLFECSIKSVIKQNNITPLPFEKRIIMKPKKLRFVYLNSSLRAHRIYFFIKLSKNKRFLRCARTSFLTSWRDCDQRIVDYDKLVNNRYVSDVFLEELKNTVKVDILRNSDYVMQMLPLRIPGESENITFKNKPWNIINKVVYDDIAIHIVTETIADYSNDMMFITEKTFKPIATMSPFIILGNANILATLRDQGYKTFSSLWDESYDSISDPLKRADAIIDVVFHLTEMGDADFDRLLCETREIVEYNYKHFLHRTPAAELTNIIKKWYI
jgi:hypothetical protein